MRKPDRKTGTSRARCTVVGCALALLGTALLPAHATAGPAGPSPAARPGTQPPAAAPAAAPAPTAMRGAEGARDAEKVRGAEDVRVLSWNIRHGGKDKKLGGARNLPLLLDQLVSLAPDVFFAIETYGAGDAIRRALTERAGKGTYRAVQVTPGKHGPSRDNLWIFTRYRVVKRFPVQRKDDDEHEHDDDRVSVSGFNTGGARVRLPGGQHLNLFDTWLSFSHPWIGHMINANARAAKKGASLPHSREDITEAEQERQVPQLREILDRRVPAMLDGDTSPTLLAGDLNTVPASDWSGAWARCPRKYGLSYDLRTTRMIEEAGFRDTYREAHPDVCAEPGSTWSPLARNRSATPARIDFVFARGRQLAVNRSFTVGERLASHPPGRFYSDHAAVVTDLKVARV
ncbi:endonuclease/exonuclease/phosphatase family protein [Streptomyces iconiensis]|uniref:Endonuclease/exonuclease/phosphatase family protein n=1 Tax=Streptomyces iconiensis TaxID=1384038 RepID=A0ABT6ZVK7_9ACTN|nr:endonuclease/exonuclease/phosphatase family protein [Streptomyces iconiensis]MDJ1133090.1 endonuclease/exonuclease/phosphatase family protein [Streptomyces iconiensis]